MTIAQSLERLNLLDSEIDEKLEDLERLRQASVSLGSFDYAKDRVQVSPSDDAPYTTIVEQIVASESEIDELIDRLADLRQTLDPHIRAVLPEDQYRAFVMRAYEKADWHKIASALNCSESTAYRKYSKAVRTIKTQDVDI